MKKKTGLIALVVCLLLAAGWFWRYTTINAYYHGLDNSSMEFYKIGDVVSLDDTVLMKEPADGFQLQVHGFEIVDTDAYVKEHGLVLPSSPEPTPERIMLVNMTVRYDGTEPKWFGPSWLAVYTPDSYAFVMGECVMLFNPELSAPSQEFQPGTSQDYIVPFAIFQNFFPASWDHLDKCEFNLSIPTSPVMKTITLK